MLAGRNACPPRYGAFPRAAAGLIFLPGPVSRATIRVLSAASLTIRAYAFASRWRISSIRRRFISRSSAQRAWSASPAAVPIQPVVQLERRLLQRSMACAPRMIAWSCR